MQLHAVLFDFSDTLFHIDHAPRIVELDATDATVSQAEVATILETVWTASATPGPLDDTGR